jgi:hypothetical protein
MTDVDGAPTDRTVEPLLLSRALQFAVAGSCGAALVHAAWLGVAPQRRAALTIFAALAAVQLGVGLWVAVRRSRPAAGAVLVSGLAAATLWAVALVVGLPWLGVETGDGVALGEICALVLSMVAAGGAGLFLTRPVRVAKPETGLVWPALVSVVVVSLLGLIGAARSVSDRQGATVGQTVGAPQGHGGHLAVNSLIPIVDPEKVTLAGTPGVTLTEQGWAESLVRRTIVLSTELGDPGVAENRGYQTLADSASGFEHVVKWSAIDDQRQFDPDEPEMLIFRIIQGYRLLVAVTYILPPTVTFDSAPRPAGSLWQYYSFDNMCLTDGIGPAFAGWRDDAGACRKAGQAFVAGPAVNVWIRPNSCGPFATLEGNPTVGRVEGDGKVRCDSKHATT